MKTLATIKGVDIIEHVNGRVEYVAGAMIDADGANSQFGKQPAYARGNKGSDYLANGGMGIGKNGQTIIVQPWARNIVIMNPATGQPREFPGGVIASKTTYKHRDKAADDPAAYVDSETVPYIAVPPIIRTGVKSIVLGCRAVLTNLQNGRKVEAAVIDIGPRTKIGELSIAAARALGIPSSPRNGGTSDKIVHYELFPGVSAVVNGFTYPLQSAG
jgi:hypothetical protein